MALERELIARVVRETIPHIAQTLRPDVLDALEEARLHETDSRGLEVLSMLCENARIARSQHLPICQDTGTVWVYLEVGEEESVPGDIFADVDEAVTAAYEDARLRMSTLRDALTDRTNPNTNTPAFCELGFRPGSGATLHIMLKGGGSDNASRVVMLPPGSGSEGIEKVVLDCVHEKASNACPPLVIGVGVGTTFDKVAGLAKKALLRPVGHEGANPDGRIAAFEARLLEMVNATGIGPGALGGATTALAVRVNTAPCHIAALPVAVNMGCCAMRSQSVTLDAYLGGGLDGR